MIHKCPVCGKEYDVLWPNLWRYKRDKTYYCTWKCLRTLDVQKPERNETGVKRQKITLEQKKEAVQIAINGKDPIAYLKGLGCADPGQAWYRIKGDLKEADPETYSKVLHMKKPAQNEHAEIVHAHAEEGIPWKTHFNAIVNPLPVAAVFSRVMYHGMYEKKLDLANRETFRMALVSNAYDNLNLELNAAQWKELSKEILVALDQLGVSE